MTEHRFAFLADSNGFPTEVPLAKIVTLPFRMI